jgi:putative phosphoesterase
MILHEKSKRFFGRKRIMLIGLMSDTHDCLPMVRTAVKEMNRLGVGFVVHAGDFVAPFVVRDLQHLQSPCIGVFGNNDGDHELLKKRMGEKEGFEIRGFFAALTIQERSIAVFHGHEPDLLEALLNANSFDLVVHGHSHQRGIVRKGKTLAVNPGEVCGYLTGIPTLALYETDSGNAEIVELEPV